MLSVQDSLLFSSKKHEKHLISVMHFVCHQGITHILIGRSAIQLIDVFDVDLFVPFHSKT